ncbi:MAG: glycosyltransferase family 39 protein, partial [Candidatus Hydrogenedentes bacterium]|nr:glycosyltransferase family 39 protein [Candidatus Hydrogenedentota bacterium]
MDSLDRSRRELRNHAKLALWLALPFIGLMLLVSPRGDFPLNDDWVYAKMVQVLANDAHFGLSPFSNAYALTQTLYAAPLVKLFGFSFTLLRLTTIFMGWITVCFTAFTARELGLPNRSAILAALTVFVNPLFINLSYTFMTDVPFCAFASISTYYFVKAFRVPTKANLLAGTLFSILAFYNRQIGAVIPTVFAFTAY